MEKVKVGLVGCGVIANGSYGPGIKALAKAEFVAVCDSVPGRAASLAAKLGVPQVYTDLDEMLARSGIDLLVDTTNIQSHYEVNLKALRAGKHVYSEKSMAGSVAEATHLIDEARQRSLKLGAAACTMLDPINQKIAQLLREGAIGKVSWLLSHNSHGGPGSWPDEEWETDPTWFYKQGAGPVLDMGVYGLHTVTGLLGPAKSMAVMSGISWPQRVVRAGPYRGKVIDVEVDDNTLLLLDFGDARFGFVDSTFCVRATREQTSQPAMQIFGSDGTIAVNGIYGSLDKLSLWRDDREREVYGWADLSFPKDTKPWGLPAGVENLIECILDPAQPVVASAEHARHVIEIMTRCYEAAREGKTIKLQTTF